jgi:hypothetical protein
MAVADALQIPVYGQKIRLSGVIVNTSTGNPITGGLTALTAFVSIDGGAFASTGLVVAEIGTTGYFTLDIDATRMTGNTIIPRVTASNASAREWTSSTPLYPAVLTEAVGFWKDQTIQRLEQSMVLLSAFCFNQHLLSQSAESVLGRNDSTVVATGSVAGLTSSGGTVTRTKMT